MKIVLTGGGTLGPVAPLVAVWQVLKEKTGNAEALFIGTATGPERTFLAQYPEIKFVSVPAGKIRRYFSLLNIFTPFLVLAGFVKAYFILLRFKPQAIVSAGGFVAVPVIWAARLLKTKIFIHQLDVEPTLSNLLVKKLAKQVTVTFAKSLADFKEQKPLLIGSLIRQEAKAAAAALDADQPKIKTILFLGGGTGAQVLNSLAIKVAVELDSGFVVWQITGKNRSPRHQLPANLKIYEFLTTNYFDLLSKADLIVSRAGLSTLMELSYLSKPALIVPIPNSQQEENASYFSDRKAAVYLTQDELTPQVLADKIKSLFNNPLELEKLQENIGKIMQHGGEEKLADLILGK